jgi:Family of unknown function (DUF5946)
VACPECGAVGVADAAGCETLFQTVIGHEFSNAALFAVHRLTVDAYSLQHPDKYMKSSKSAAAHLVGMCWSLEYGGGLSVSRAISRWLDGSLELPRVPPPEPCLRGALTIREVHDAGGGPAHVDRVRAWAADVWSAWTVGHGQARLWVEAITEDSSGTA